MGQIRQNTIRRKAQRERKRLGLDGAKKGYFESAAETALCERDSLERRVRACQEILQYLQHPSSRRIGKEKRIRYRAALDAVVVTMFCKVQANETLSRHELNFLSQLSSWVSDERLRQLESEIELIDRLMPDDDIDEWGFDGESNRIPLPPEGES
ncbi:MAG: hypothetical protein KDA87_15280 [Planctomycetales bacterium]|nr:hypothetical protein [Planctomycetales bacterium]